MGIRWEFPGNELGINTCYILTSFPSGNMLGISCFIVDKMFSIVSAGNEKISRIS
jgi:hypothetical protein